MHRTGWALAFVLTACGGPPGAPVKAAGDEPTQPNIVVNLDHAEAAEALSVVAQLLEEPVLVDARSLVWLRCVTVTMREPEPLPRKVAAEQLFDALRAQGVRIERLGYSKRDGATWIVKIDERPASCPVPEGEGLVAAGGGAAGTDAGVGVGAGSASDAGGAGAESDAVLAEVLRSIREISPTEHAVTRRGLDLFLENQPLLLRSARIVPEEAGGKVVGIRLFGVRADGVLGRLGFLNGDRVDSVMGKSVGTPDQALEAYATMRGAKVIEIDVVRRGTPTKMVVRVE